MRNATKLASLAVMMASAGVATQAVAQYGYPEAINTYCSTHGGLKAEYVGQLDQASNFANYPAGTGCSVCHSGTSTANANKAYYSSNKATPDNFCVGVAVNHAPTVNPISITGTAGTAISYTASATDADAGDTTFTFAATGLPSGATFSSAGVFTWTSPVAGNYTFSVTATDAHGATSAAVTASVKVSAPANVPPVVTAPSTQTGTEGTALNFTVTASDADGSVASLTASGLPSGATFSGGSFDWTAPVAGDYTVTFTATDNSGATGSAKTAIHIAALPGPVNTLPQLTVPMTQQNVTVNQPLTFDVTAVDAEDDLTITSANLPAGATLSTATQDLTTGVWTSKFTWTPTAVPATNPVTVTFTATEVVTDPAATAQSTSKNVKVQVNPVAGTATISSVSVTKALWNSRLRKIQAGGSVKPLSGKPVPTGLMVTISDESGAQIGSPVPVRKTRTGYVWSFTSPSLSSVPCEIKASAGGVSADANVSKAPSTCYGDSSDDGSSDDSSSTSTSTSTVTTTPTSSGSTTTPGKGKGKNK